MLRINKNQQLELCFQDILPNSTNLFTGLSMAARRENCFWNLGSYRVWPVAKQQTRLVTRFDHPMGIRDQLARERTRSRRFVNQWLIQEPLMRGGGVNF